MFRMMRFRHAALLAGMLWFSAPAGGQDLPSGFDQEHREIFRELVEINTSPAGGSVAPAAQAVAKRLAAAGFAP
jgi:hypothetical protein